MEPGGYAVAGEGDDPMSMIYECPTCHKPQGAGQTSCASCGADFDGAVPDDALVPETPERAPAENEGEDGPSAVETIAAPVMEAVAPLVPPEPDPQLEFVPPPLPPTYEPPVYQPPAYQPPPSYAAPPNYPINSQSPQPKSGIVLPRGLLIALPIVLVLVLGVVLFTRSLDQSSEAVPAPPSSSPVVAPIAAPTPVSSAVTLQGGAASSQPGSNMAKWLAGRWQAKSSDYYVFNDNGTGSRGSITGKLAGNTFVWVMAQNQITLYLADKQEKLALSPGPDDSTLFLRGDDGRYVQFVRTKANA